MVHRELGETEGYVCCKYKQMEPVDPIKQDTGTALTVRAAAMPRESRRGLEKPLRPNYWSILTDMDVFSGIVIRPVVSTSVAAGWALSTFLSGLAPKEGLRLWRPGVLVSLLPLPCSMPRGD